jgi:hypothetical protein
LPPTAYTWLLEMAATPLNPLFGALVMTERCQVCPFQCSENGTIANRPRWNPVPTIHTSLVDGAWIVSRWAADTPAAPGWGRTGWTE